MYVVRYDFVLGENITIPSGSVLEFDGGSINGSYTINGNNTGINTGFVKIFNTNVTLAGRWNVVEAYPEWFGAVGDGVADDTNAIQSTIDSFSMLYLLNKVYLVTDTITLPRNQCKFKGVEKHKSSGMWLDCFSTIRFIPSTPKRFIYFYADRSGGDITYAHTFENIKFNFGNENAYGIQFGKVTNDNSIPNIKDYPSWNTISDDSSVDNNCYYHNVIFKHCDFGCNSTNFGLLRAKCFESIVENCTFQSAKYANIKYGCDNIKDYNNTYNGCHYCSLHIGNGTFTVNHTERDINIVNLNIPLKIGLAGVHVNINVDGYYQENQVGGNTDYEVTINASTNQITGLPSDLDYLPYITPFKVVSNRHGEFFTTIHEDNGVYYMDSSDRIDFDETLTITLYTGMISFYKPLSLTCNNVQMQNGSIYVIDRELYYSRLSIHNVECFNVDNEIKAGRNKRCNEMISRGISIDDWNFTNGNPRFNPNVPIKDSPQSIFFDARDSKFGSYGANGGDLSMYHRHNLWGIQYNNTHYLFKTFNKSVDIASVYRCRFYVENLYDSVMGFNQWYLALADANLQNTLKLINFSTNLQSNVPTILEGYFTFPDNAYDYVAMTVGGGYQSNTYLCIYWASIEKVEKGSGSVRPTLKSSISGFEFFDTTLGKPIYWNGTAWVDATGAQV